MKIREYKIEPGADLQHANLQHAILRGAELQHASLRRADLQGANLQHAILRRADLQGANLQHAILRGADLRRADLQGANLQHAILRGADLRRANLQHADLHGANLDFSAWPLSCDSLGVKIDENIARQLAYHLASVLPDEFKKDAQWLFDFANEWAGISKHDLKGLRREE